MASAAVSAVSAPGEPAYRRREPEKSVLWGIVAAEAQGLREAVAAASDYARGLPRHVDKELDAFLACGLLSNGFARVVCRRCREEHLVAFSCNNRAICPSCTGRRMADTAAALVDRVLPYADYRRWVVTFPARVRYHLAADPKLATAVNREVLRAIFAWQRRCARALGHKPQRANSNAAVTFVQRFNSALELALDLHILIPDALFLPDLREPFHPDARPRIVDLDPPTDDDVATLLDEIIARTLKVLRKFGRLDEDPDEPPEPHLLLASKSTRAPRTVPYQEEPLPRLCARKDGYSLHAGTAVHRNDRKGLENLCRYGLRPPLAQGRLSRAADGTVLYQMKRRFSDGRHVLRFEPQAFLDRLCALVPPRRFHRVRYAGAIAPHCRGRFALTGRGMHDAKDPAAPVASTTAPSAPATAPAVTTAPTAPAPTVRVRHPDDPDDPTRDRRLAWASLMRRSFGIDVLQCPTCSGRMELIATIEDPDVAAKILKHLGLPARAPPRPPPWRPPQQRLPASDHHVDQPSAFE